MRVYVPKTSIPHVGGERSSHLRQIGEPGWVLSLGDRRGAATLSRRAAAGHPVMPRPGESLDDLFAHCKALMATNEDAEDAGALPAIETSSA